MINAFIKKDYVKKGLSRLQHDFSSDEKSPRIRGLLSLILEGYQSIEYGIWGFFGVMDLETSAGVWLDNHGRRLNETRDGLTDREYRTFLGAKQKIRRLERNQVINREIFAEIISDISNAIPDGVYVIKKSGGLRVQYTVAMPNSDAAKQKIKKFAKDMLGLTTKIWISEHVIGNFGFKENETSTGYDAGPYSFGL